MTTPSPEDNTTPQPDAPEVDADGHDSVRDTGNATRTHELAPRPETRTVVDESGREHHEDRRGLDDALDADDSAAESGASAAAFAPGASSRLSLLPRLLLPRLLLPRLLLPRLSRIGLPVFDAKVWRLQCTGLLLSLVVCAVMSLYVLNFAQRNDFERQVLAGLPLWKSIESWEYSLYNERFVQRGVIKPKSYDKIAIIAINQSSFNALGTWPWPRSYHAKVIRRLKKAGARVIAVDINFSEKQFPIVDKKTGAIKGLSEYDKDLIAATAEAGNVIYPAAFRHERKVTGADAAVSFITSPFDELDAETADVALNFLPLDPDDGARRYGVRGEMSGEDLGSFSSLAVAMFQNKLDGNENTAYYKLLKANVWPDAQGVLHHIPVSETRFGDNRIWTTPFHFWGPAGTFDTYSFSDVKEEFSDAQLKKLFGGRIVFIGANIEILEDLFKMPSFVSPSGSQGAGRAGTATIPGVELHATYAAMLLDGAYEYTVSTAATLWTLLGLTLLSTVWTALLHGWISKAARWTQLRWSQVQWPLRLRRLRVHGFVWFGLYALLGALPVVAFWWVAQQLFIQRNLWVIVVYPALGAMLSSGLMLLLLFGAEAAERRKALTQFSRLVAPDVMEEILAHPEEEYPRPRRVYATVLFTDLEGFTSYSEEHEPEDVVEALNAYLERMRPIVQAHGGSVDKYIGDAIMAFFGVPVPRFDHAAQALHCAIAMQQECARFREETGIPFYMRVGVHTGELIVGSIGSEQQLNYTVIGDTVNLASRLESTNKEFGSWIMCSSDTYDAAPDVACVESARTQIKGKSQAVDVFIVRGLHGSPACDAQWGRGSLDPASAINTTLPALPETANSALP